MSNPSPLPAPGQQPGRPFVVDADQATETFRRYATAIARRRFSEATGPHRELLKLGFSVLLRRPRGGGR